MSKELTKRIITSLFLIIGVIFNVFLYFFVNYFIDTYFYNFMD